MSEEDTGHETAGGHDAYPTIGPASLHGDNPIPPQLENGAGWSADPLLVVGCDAYVDGEYLYQDYIYDDHGADTRSVLEPSPDGEALGGFYSRPTGDYRYPRDPDRYAYNAADLLEFRVRLADDGEGVVYRFSLNTMLAPDAAAVAVGIDTDPDEDGTETTWGYGLGTLGVSIDHCLVTWGTGAEFDGERLGDDRVSVDVERNQIEVAVPVVPDGETWRHYCVVGLWNDEKGEFMQIALDADESVPGGAHESQGVPPVFNVAFRFDEPMERNVDLTTLLPRLASILVNAPTDLVDTLDDPLRLATRLDILPRLLDRFDDSLAMLNPLDNPLNPLGSASLSNLMGQLDRFWIFSDTHGVPRVLGIGNWREHRQATALADRDISPFHVDIDFSHLREKTTQRRIPDSGHLSCLYPSRQDFGQGVDPYANILRGRIQPYNVYIPENLSEPAPMVTMLHSLGNSYNQYPVWMPRYVEDLAETCNAVMFMPQTRGPGIWYKREAEIDVFEAWRDLETRFDIDRTSVSITGYSMGGFGAIMLATKHPDLFGRCFPVVGPPAEDPIEAPTNNLFATPSLVLHELFGGEGGGRLFTIFNEEPENALRLTENLRHVPMLLWHGGTDPLVPLLGPTNYASRLRSHGYRHQIDVFPSDHFLLALQDRWDRGPEYLSETEVPTYPARVTYRRIPDFDYPDLGIIHDACHWVTDISVRPDSENGLVDAISLAEGYGEPLHERYTTTGTRPMAYTASGINWTQPDETRGPANVVELTLEGVDSVTIWIEACRLDPNTDLTLTATSDGPATVTLKGSFGEHELDIPEGQTTETLILR